MSSFWRTWLNVWCVGVGLFGLVLAGAAFEATSGATRLIFGFLGNPIEGALEPHTQFSLAVLGAVSMGWAVVFYAAFDAAHKLGANGRTTWLLITDAAIVWYVVDTTLSVATGFPMNAVPNTILAIGFLIPLLASGVLKRDAPSATLQAVREG